MKMKKSLIFAFLTIATISICVCEPPIGRKNPTALDVAQEAVVQHTAKTVNLFNTMQSQVEIERSRYKILGSAYNKNEILKESTQKYQKDPEAYYPYVKPQKDSPPNPDKRPYLNRDSKVYEKDKKAYYNPSYVYRKTPQPYVGKDIPVDLGETSRTFPTEQNLIRLHNELKAIDARNAVSLNEASVKGYYMKDPKPYYDPTFEDTLDSKNEIKKNIQAMKKDLDRALTDKLKAHIGTIPVHQEVENQFNYDSEVRNKVIKDNYYNEVVNFNGYHTEIPPEAAKQYQFKRSPPPRGNKETADVVEHNVEEAVEKNTQEGETGKDTGVYYTPQPRVPRPDLLENRPPRSNEHFKPDRPVEFNAKSNYAAVTTNLTGINPTARKESTSSTKNLKKK